MGLLARGQAMLNRRLGDTEAAPAPVTYTRRVNGVAQSVALSRARYGRTLFSGLQQAGAAVQWGERDYLIEVAELVLGGEPTTPQRGDRIADGPETWELAGPQTDEACWRYSDQFRTAYRCHAKRVP